jgi:hypothetical protein
MIRVTKSAENIVSTVSIVSAVRSDGSRGDQAAFCWDERINNSRALTMLTVLTQIPPFVSGSHR